MKTFQLRQDTLSADCLASDGQWQAYLDWLGLRFDPFASLDASSDPRLGDYLVGHEAFAAVWGDYPSLAFAPAGGGKTALRVRVMQACWVGQDTNHPFPLPYVPSFLAFPLPSSPALEDHLEALTQSAAQRLLLALAYYPRWLFRLNGEAQRMVGRLLAWDLPTNPDYYLDQCVEAHGVAPLLDSFDPAFILPDAPSVADLSRLRDTLAIVDVTARASPLERWALWQDVLLNQLGFRCIYVLMDGLDASPQTMANARAIAEFIAPLVKETGAWAARRVYIKAFLPVETRPLVRSCFNEALISAQEAIVEWTEPLLAEVVRRRLYSASLGAYGSLDAVCSPAVRDVETALARAIIPLPREILRLTQRVLWEHILCHGPAGVIEPEDLEAAIKWYTAERNNGVADVC